MIKKAQCESAELEDTVSICLDEENREVTLFGPVNAGMASEVVSAIRKLDFASDDAISLVMCSPGGEEGAGWAIYDTLILSRSKVIGQCFGECMSIAVLILQGCDARLLSPNCRMMVHNGSIGVAGPAEKVAGAVKEQGNLTKMYYEKLIEKSELSLDQIKKLCDNETYMDAEVAVGYGLADGILGQVKQIGQTKKSKKRGKK